MPEPPRRSFLAAIALSSASAASIPFASVAAAAPAAAGPFRSAAATPGAAGVVPAAAASSAASAATVAPFPLPAGLASVRSSVALPDLNASYFAQVTLADPLTVSVLPGNPARTEVTSGGRHVATLTHGARTVVLTGPERTFAENKKPFADDFQRTLPDLSLPEEDRVGWGSSPGGGSWSTLGPDAGDYSVVPGKGLVTLTTDYASRHASLRDDDVLDVDVRCSASFDKRPTGEACSFALSFGYQDTHNSYRARLSFVTSGDVQFRLEKEVDDTVTQLATVLTLATNVAAGTEWTIRVRREGSRAQAKAWPSASAEPAGWALEATDATFAAGRVGLRALANQGCTNLPVQLAVSRYQVDEANWSAPPVVTHDSWVRVLPEPFDGVWNDGIEQTVRSWAGSTAPDVLAHAAMFLSGAPAITAGSGPAAGRQVLGEAGYGYLDPQGYRYEGADFHEYMGIGWTFSDGQYTGPSSKQTGNLDCSGYTRMVYGYHLGVPTAAGADESGERLPRKSRDMADHAPGVVVDRTDGTAPPAAALIQPGDLVLFNADSGDDVSSPTTDHVGIHLGVDTAGRRRFLSSRKTVDGPTMGDLGGASTLDGTGLYARTLHTVRRI